MSELVFFKFAVYVLIGVAFFLVPQFFKLHRRVGRLTVRSTLEARRSDHLEQENRQLKRMLSATVQRVHTISKLLEERS